MYNSENNSFLFSISEPCKKLDKFYFVACVTGKNNIQKVSRYGTRYENSPKFLALLDRQIRILKSLHQNHSLKRDQQEDQKRNPQIDLFPYANVRIL